MSNPITVKIDVSKIDKTKLFKGAKGTYLDIILMPSENNQYGNDFMVVQSVTKEERDAGVRGAILGNAKFLKKKGSAPTQLESQPSGSSGESDDIPF